MYLRLHPGGTRTKTTSSRRLAIIWNEIVRSCTVGRKVVKAENAGKEIGEQDRENYERALRKLGEEARGETT
jgi:hypothetical protein